MQQTVYAYRIRGAWYYNLMLKIKCFLLFIAISCVTTAMANEVKRWQDARGQWHYGAGATARPQSQSVRIQQPISVVKNDQPLAPARFQKQADRAVTTVSTRRSATSLDDADQKKARCDTLRNQLDEARMLARQSSSNYYRQLDMQYNRDCILGR